MTSRTGRGRFYQVPNLDPQAHRIVKRLHKELVDNKMSVKELSAKTGVTKTTIRAWFHNAYSINLQSLDYCLAVFNLAAIATLPRGVTGSCKPPKPAPRAEKPKTSPSSTSTPAKMTVVEEAAKLAPTPEPKKLNADRVVRPVSLLDVWAKPQPIPKPKKKIEPLF